ncbi:MAG: exosortase O [Ardenticatenaceae bacterium]|nr:exosortase O [Ardenticatenaceae bacterium]
MTTIETKFEIFKGSNTLQIALNLLIWLAWGWLYWPLAEYLQIIFTRQDFRTNQILLVGIVILIVIQIKQQGWHLRLNRSPSPAFYPLVLVLGGSAGFLLTERFLDVHTLAASLFGLATYGLIGLWLAPERWRQGLPAALLLIGTLPFGAHLQTFVGYPMRIATAAIVRDGLAAAGVGSVGIDTILVFENGVAHVDLPCSGVQSLWTGALFLLAASWIERRPLNVRWVMVAAVYVILLFIANLTRVGVLITVGEVWGWRLLAEMLHVPLGVLGFAGACAAAVLLLRWVGESRAAEHTATRSSQKPKQRHLFSLGLMITFAVMALLYAPRPQIGLAGDSPAAWRFPAGLEVEPLPLKPDEQEWLTRDGAEAADRYRFTWGEYSGSMILITSRTWRAHHRPERCFEVYGLSLDSSQTFLVSPTQPIRQVALSDDSGQRHLSAAYWFQSAEQTTDDYATRIWADLAPQRQRWVLVSVVFDETVEGEGEDVGAFYRMLEEVINSYLLIANN